MSWGAKTLAYGLAITWKWWQWAASAAAAGFHAGSTPQVGAIASWDDGICHGKQLFLSCWIVTRIQVSEYSYDGKWNSTSGNYRGWF